MGSNFYVLAYLWDRVPSSAALIILGLGSMRGTTTSYNFVTWRMWNTLLFYMLMLLYMFYIYLRLYSWVDLNMLYLVSIGYDDLYLMAVMLSELVGYSGREKGFKWVVWIVRVVRVF